MTSMNAEDAVNVARKHLVLKGIETTQTKSVKRVPGSLRGKYLPEKDRDFWIVTFLRSTSMIISTDDLSHEELEILATVADENGTISVAVEDDGASEVI